MSTHFDTRQVAATFDRMERRSPVAQAMLLAQGQQMVIEAAQPLTPVDTGLLVNSYQAPTPVGEFGVVVNSCPYALYVHERTGDKHDDGIDHFLLTAVILVTPAWHQMVAARWLPEVT